LVFGNSRIFPEFLLAVDIFGLGDFSRTLFILFATQVFDSLIRESVAGIAVGLYTPYLPRESLRGVIHRPMSPFLLLHPPEIGTSSTTQGKVVIPFCAFGKFMLPTARLHPSHIAWQ